MGEILWHWVFKEPLSKVGLMDSKKAKNDSVKKLEKNKKAPQGASEKELEGRTSASFND